MTKQEWDRELFSTGPNYTPSINAVLSRIRIEASLPGADQTTVNGLKRIFGIDVMAEQPASGGSKE